MLERTHNIASAPRFDNARRMVVSRIRWKQGVEFEADGTQHVLEAATGMAMQQRATVWKLANRKTGLPVLMRWALRDPFGVTSRAHALQPV